MAHIVLTFDNNKLASALYGQFDENLARLEQKLGVDIRSRGNQLTIRGRRRRGRAGAPRARPSLRHPAEGRDIGAVRRRRRGAHGDRGRRPADAADAGTQGQDGRRPDLHPQAHDLRRARPTRTPICGRCERSELRLRHRAGRHRQDLSRRRPCGDAAGARHGRAHHPVAARRSRPASGSASCPAT